MWEYRLTWPGSKPPNWDALWRRGLDAIRAEGRDLEARPDTYLVLLGRADAGLKLRGGNEDDFDVKVRHSRKGGWELWEKVAFPRWNTLEAVRLATLLQIAPPKARSEGPTPAQGVARFLDLAGVERREVTAQKERIQAAAGGLMTGWPGCRAEPGWLAELVQIQLPGRTSRLVSMCLEAFAPPADETDPLSDPTALRGGYPELLLRHLTAVL